MSFKDAGQCEFDLNPEAGEAFLDDLKLVLGSAAQNPLGDASVILGDARNLPGCLDARFDVVVTSPPYANRMSYIRELRPYMYWLGYLVNGRDAAELDWLAIGGTWGVATSRLADWSASEDFWTPEALAAVVSDIAHGDNKNGALLANYVAKYCEDMSRHFAGLCPVLNSRPPPLHCWKLNLLRCSCFYGTSICRYAPTIRFRGCGRAGDPQT